MPASEAPSLALLKSSMTLSKKVWKIRPEDSVKLCNTVLHESSARHHCAGFVKKTAESAKLSGEGIHFTGGYTFPCLRAACLSLCIFPTNLPTSLLLPADNQAIRASAVRPYLCPNIRATNCTGRPALQLRPTPLH